MAVLHKLQLWAAIEQEGRSKPLRSWHPVCHTLSTRFFTLTLLPVNRPVAAAAPVDADGAANGQLSAVITK